MPIYTDTRTYHKILLNIFIYLLMKWTGLSFNEPILLRVYTTARFGGLFSIKSRLGEKIQMHFTVEATHPNVPYVQDPITAAADAEGNPLTEDQLADFAMPEPVPDHPEVVGFVDGPNGREVQFGTSGVCTMIQQPTYQGANFGDPIVYTFTVPAGPPVSITGGGAHFGDLTPDA